MRQCVPDSSLVLGYTGHDRPAGLWMDSPNSTVADNFDFWSLHPGGCNFLFADGSVRFLKQTIDPRAFGSLFNARRGRGRRGRCVLRWLSARTPSPHGEDGNHPIVRGDREEDTQRRLEEDSHVIVSRFTNPLRIDAKCLVDRVGGPGDVVPVKAPTSRSQPAAAPRPASEDHVIQGCVGVLGPKRDAGLRFVGQGEDLNREGTLFASSAVRFLRKKRIDARASACAFISRCLRSQAKVGDCW